MRGNRKKASLHAFEYHHTFTWLITEAQEAKALQGDSIVGVHRPHGP